jgi:DNA-binding NarL/FixJ family response regulator
VGRVMLNESVRTRVGLISEEPIRQTGIASAFEGHATIAMESGRLEELLSDRSIRYLLVDASSNSAWLETLISVRRARPDMRQMVLGPVATDEMILRFILAGARAYLDSNCGPSVLRHAVTAVIEGSIWAPRRLLTVLIDRLQDAPVLKTVAVAPALSRRERQVMDLIMTANSNRQIAVELGIEERTVKAYVASLFRKTGVGNRVSLSMHGAQEAMRNKRA